MHGGKVQGKQCPCLLGVKIVLLDAECHWGRYLCLNGGMPASSAIYCKSALNVTFFLVNRADLMENFKNF